jgi:predicted Zn-ribbon and HTH transcriptional regulator
MNQHDVIKQLKRFPDKISNEKMTAKTWKCSTCGTEYKSAEGKMTIPSPCNVCEGIFFEKLS